MKGDRLGEFEEFTLLALCALDAPLYAVPVQRFLEAQTDRDVSMGAVYAALGRLEAKGFLRSSLGPASGHRGGKPKRVYDVTASGFRTARSLHHARVRIWQLIGEGRRS